MRKNVLYPFHHYKYEVPTDYPYHRSAYPAKPGYPEWTKNYDPSRLVNPASGGNHRACGDILDLHNYPGPSMFLFDPQRVTVLGEYGGIGLPLENHLWWNKRNWGYVQFKNSDEVTAEYVKYANELKEMVDRGFSAAVYTQTTDVEGEVNGLMTYDRKEIKINEAAVKKANQYCNAIINHVLDIASVFGHNQFLFFCIIFHYHIHLSGKCTYFN